MFKQFGVLTFNKTDYTYDQLFELSMEIEALDVLDEEDESEYKILCLPENFQKTVEFFDSKNLKPNSSELTRIAENTIEISDFVDNPGMVNSTLAKNDVIVDSISNKSIDLEDYFMKVIGGNKDA